MIHYLTSITLQILIIIINIVNTNLTDVLLLWIIKIGSIATQKLNYVPHKI